MAQLISSTTRTPLTRGSPEKAAGVSGEDNPWVMAEMATTVASES